MRITFALPTVVLAAGALLTGCVSPEQYTAERRQRLLKVYPLGTTTRADVTARWGGQPATDIAQRPSAGWGAHGNPAVRQRCLASEQRIGKRVESCERRLGADGFYSLCYCWFYYDRRDRLVDAEWQGRSD